MIRRVAIAVQGIVQGVGFRPFVFNLARSEQLSGWVLNDADAVRIEVQGAAGAIERFVASLRTDAPPQARIDRLEVDQLAVRSGDGEAGHGDTGHGDTGHGDTGFGQFKILKSKGSAAPRATIPADLGICAECLAEIRNSHERRYRYPFTNCTNCGPRWSIITGLPYDRTGTSMNRFAICDRCRSEYDDPTDRRFHAQPIACAECGPRLQLLSSDGEQQSVGDQALIEAAAAVYGGKIVAVRGLGGFQLIANACSQSAVKRLRERKHRPDKPFAVMFAGLADLQHYCLTSHAEQQVLCSAQAPIVLLRRRPNAIAVPLDAAIADGVAPGNPYLGAMLPYTPLHFLLIDEIGVPIVCTSGNRSEEPMAITTEDALARLADIADLVLTHDRQVVRPVDDSVVCVVDDHTQVLRRARGYAPLPVRLGAAAPTILAVGGQLKNTIALNLGADAIISPHIGDLDNRLGMDAHQQAIFDLVSFFRATPEAIACDLHPDYRSTRIAERLAGQWSVPLVRIQHHHAHVLSVIAEHNLQGAVLGLAWDGTGFGLDGTVWGGEALLCASGGSTRVAHLRTFALPGGDRAVREPRRTTLGLLYEMHGVGCRPFVDRWFKEAQLTPLLAALERPAVFPRCSSMGRLFDAVAALCGFDLPSSFEGQAAMALEFVADWQESGEYPLPISNDQPMVVDWQPLVQQLLADRAAGCQTATLSARFHNSLATLAVEITRRVGVRQVALTGGCFQNRLLSKRVTSRLLESGVDVYTPLKVPPGDGGIALGQILGATFHVGS